jgi:hypothetical protein
VLMRPSLAEKRRREGCRKSNLEISRLITSATPRVLVMSSMTLVVGVGEPGEGLLVAWKKIFSYVSSEQSGTK